MTVAAVIEGVSPRYEGLTADQLVGFLRLDVAMLPLAQQIALTWAVEQALRDAMASTSRSECAGASRM